MLSCPVPSCFVWFRVVSRGVVLYCIVLYCDVSGGELIRTRSSRWLEFHRRLICSISCATQVCVSPFVRLHDLMHVLVQPQPHLRAYAPPSSAPHAILPNPVALLSRPPDLSLVPPSSTPTPSPRAQSTLGGRGGGGCACTDDGGRSCAEVSDQWRAPHSSN